MPSEFLQALQLGAQMSQNRHQRELARQELDLRAIAEQRMREQLAESMRQFEGTQQYRFANIDAQNQRAMLREEGRRLDRAVRLGEGQARGFFDADGNVIDPRQRTQQKFEQALELTSALGLEGDQATRAVANIMGMNMGQEPGVSQLVFNDLVERYGGDRIEAFRQLAAMQKGPPTPRPATSHELTTERNATYGSLMGVIQQELPDGDAITKEGPIAVHRLMNDPARREDAGRVLQQASARLGKSPDELMRTINIEAARAHVTTMDPVRQMLADMLSGIFGNRGANVPAPPPGEIPESRPIEQNQSFSPSRRFIPQVR